MCSDEALLSLAEWPPYAAPRRGGNAWDNGNLQCDALRAEGIAATAGTQSPRRVS